MLWGAHAALAAPARPDRGASTSARRWRIPGVEAVLTADDVPGAPTYGLISHGPAGVRPRRRALRGRAGRRRGRRSPRDGAGGPLDAIVVELRGARPARRPRGAIDGAPPIHPDGNVIRHQRIAPRRSRRDGRRRRRGDLRDRHAGPGLPRPRGRPGHPRPATAGVELYVATQWLHEDREQVAACLGLPDEQVRLHARRGRWRLRRPRGHQPAGPPCLLALRTGRPVKMAYAAGRVVPRPRPPPPGPHLDTPPRHRRRRPREGRGRGRARRWRLRLVVVGGASPTPSRFAAGPYRCPTPRSTATAVRTNNPPCGAMRGFGVVQACFAHEAQMDKLAAGAAGSTRSRCGCATRCGPATVLITGQVITGTRAGGRVHPGGAATTRCRRRPATALTRCAAGRRRPHRRRRPRRAAASGCAVGYQEPHVLRGLRRLRRRPGAGWPTASRR